MTVVNLQHALIRDLMPIHVHATRDILEMEKIVKVRKQKLELLIFFITTSL